MLETERQLAFSRGMRMQNATRVHKVRAAGRCARWAGAAP